MKMQTVDFQNSPLSLTNLMFYELHGQSTKCEQAVINKQAANGMALYSQFKGSWPPWPARISHLAFYRSFGLCS